MTRSASLPPSTTCALQLVPPRLLRWLMSHDLFVIYDEDIGSVVHVITSRSCLTLSDAIEHAKNGQARISEMLYLIKISGLCDSWVTYAGARQDFQNSI